MKKVNIKGLFKMMTKSSTLKYPVKDTLKWLFTDLAMRKRLMVTVGIAVIVQIISCIPLPGINISNLLEFFRGIAQIHNRPILNAFLLLSSGQAFKRLTIFSLGLMPFFSSCLLLQLGSFFIPILKKYSFGGEDGRQRIAKLTYIFTIALSIIQSYFIALWLENPARFSGMQLVANPGFVFRLMVTVTMTASVILLLFISDIINRYGIGNGVAIIFVSPFLLKTITAVNQIVKVVQDENFPVSSLVILAGTVVGLAYAVFYITNRNKVIKLQDNKQNEITLNLKSNIVGCEPLGWGSGLMRIPLTIASFAGIAWLQRLAVAIEKNFIVPAVISTVLIIAFTYVYAVIVFNPKYLSGLANKYGYSVVTGKGKNAEEYLDNNMSKVLVITALVLSAINIIPNLIMGSMKISYSISNLFTGTALLLVVGVFSDIVSQAEFFKAKSDSGVKDWAICYTAFDEFEAKIKTGFLKGNGIQALIEPLRFSWGMPVRTAVDQYRIYVPSNKQETARSLLLR